ncbi:diguanylate cyclase [Robbsia sp. Bb-Pol-6]|uniref:Diguanylate cyclase n=1 Tax=Robbsia betulipollinis TaxID=2981849 RepID=A0ABT3ZSH6_9BURK|nr:diguanylate cyclase [Robbsia betulipollinis]MCY0389504.1 diguanylate cyclase [Robbsia betulipollinis]
MDRRSASVPGHDVASGVTRSPAALLRRLGMLDAPAEESFDRITRLAARLLDVPIAVISVFDGERQWLKSRVGVTVQEMPRHLSFCNDTLRDDALTVVSDLRADPRFQNHPAVVDAPFLRFYAGLPLRSLKGWALGTLCVTDTRVRTLDAAQIAAFEDLCAMAQNEISQREIAARQRRVHRADLRALEESKAVFQAAFQEAAIGFVIIDLQGRCVQVNSRFAALLDYEKSALSQLPYQDLLFSEDCIGVQRDATRMLNGELAFYSSERQYRRRDGQPVWANVTVALARTAEGQPLHYVAVAEDISARKAADANLAELQHELEARVLLRTAELRGVNLRLANALEERDRTIAERDRAEAALRASRETLQTITDNLPVLIAYIDADLRYRFTNATYGHVFGDHAESRTGRHVSDVLTPGTMAALLPWFRRALAGERVTNDDVVYDATSQRIWSATYIPHFTAGRVDGFYVVSHDVTERKRLETSLREQALQDALTGLPNRRALGLQLTQALTQEAALAVLFLDLDEFKQINDHAGHEVGDSVLKEVAHRLRMAVDDQDMVARLAGDEFVVVLRGSHCMPGDAERLAGDIVAAFGLPIAISGALHFKLGISIGIASYHAQWHASAPSANGLLAIADRAMYVAKAQGKNTYHAIDTHAIPLPDSHAMH